MWAYKLKKTRQNSLLPLLIAVVLLSAVLSGCQEAVEIEEPDQVGQTFDPYVNIGSLVDVVNFNPVSVKGIGLVMLPDETGSAECPPDVRSYLKQYILTHISGETSVSAETLINSKKTAVVMVEGRVPAGAVLTDVFDVKITSLPNTQTTSLAGGRLFSTDMHMVIPSKLGVGTSKARAVAAGPVFIDKISTVEVNFNSGYVLAGGKVIQAQEVALALFKPDYRTIGLIRNRINERFGGDVANAISDGVIYLSVPEAFREQREKFIALVRALYIAPNALSQSQQIDRQIEKLHSQENKYPAEIVLEAIGKSSLDKLKELLSSSDANVRLSAARCMLNIGDGRSALKILREIALDKNSADRIEAIAAVATAADSKDVIALMSRLIHDDDFEIKFAAYEYIRNFDNIAISRTVIADAFYVEEIYQTGDKVILVSRNSMSRIALFGSPINCQGGIFIESDDGRIIINAQKEDKYISVMRKYPRTGSLIGPLKCRRDVSDLIRTLGASLVAEKQKRERPGLEIPYSDIIAILKKMCQRGAINAEFVMSELPSTF